MASRNVQGVLARVSSKPWHDDKYNKDITLYSFQLEGSNQWFRTGTKTINAGVGQTVKFAADGANVDMGTFAIGQPVTVATDSIREAPASPAPTTTTSTNQSAKTGNLSKDGYWDAKEARDLAKEARFQAVNEPRMALSVAVDAASRLVSVALDKDALSFGNAAKAKRVGILSAFTKELALDLATFISDAPNQLAAYKPGVGISESSTKEEEVQE